MDNGLKAVLDMRVEKVIKNLEKRNMKGYHVKSRDELFALLGELVPAGATVANGGSMTLEELGFSKNILIKHALKGYTLGRVVDSVEKDTFIAETNEARRIYEENREKAKAQGKRIPSFPEPSFKKKPDECHYYISEKKKYTAEMRFNANGSGYGTFFFVLLIAIICVIMIYALLPQLLTLVDKSLNDFTVQGNTYVPGQ